MEKLARMLLDHLEGILNYCRTKVPMGVIEAVNGNIKALLRRGRGYRDVNYLLLKAQRLAATKTEFRHLDTAFGTTKHGRERNKQHLAQVMPGLEVARIRHRLKYDKEIAHRRVLHNDEDTRQNPSSTKAQVEFYSHAIPLG